MNPHRTCQENMDALKKVLTQRTLLALSRRNVEFVLAHQADSKQQLADYLRQCRAELGHSAGADTYENSIRSFCGNCATRGDPDTQILFC